MAGWDKILMGMVAVLAIFILMPGARRAMKHVPTAGQGDWITVAIILAAVVGFVFVLLQLV